MVAVLIGVSIVPAASAEYRIDVVWDGVGVGASADDGRGRFASAHAAASFGDAYYDESIGRFMCQGETHYYARAGPLGLDLGTSYYAEGDGIVLDYKDDSATFPDQAEVEDQEQGPYKLDTRFRPEASSEAWHKGLVTAQASARDSATCTK